MERTATYLWQAIKRQKSRPVKAALKILLKAAAFFATSTFLPTFAVLIFERYVCNCKNSRPAIQG